MTESPPETDAAADADAALAATPLTGLADVITTGDHKTIGMLYVKVSLLLGVVVAAVSALAAIEQGDTASFDIFASADQLFQAQTFGHVGLALLVVAPLMVGLGTAMVPLQVGSTAIAFPRAAAAAFWGWLIGAGIFVASYLIDGGFGGLENRVAPESVELTLLATAMMVIALLLGVLCIATTVVALRPDGMDLAQVPAFSWSMLVTGVMWLVSLPVLLANLAIVWADMRDLVPNQTGFSFGALDKIWAQVDWAFSGPQAFMFAIPVLGLAADMIPVAAKVRQTMYGVVLGAIAAFGLFTFGAFLQTAFLNEPTIRVRPFNIVLLLQALLLGGAAFAVFGGLGNTLRLGGRNIRTPHPWLLGGLGALLMLLAGAGANILRSIEPLDLEAASSPASALGTATGIGVANYALLAGLLGGLAGLYYFAPKLTGRKLAGLGGAAAMLAVLVGTILAGLPLVIAGFLDPVGDNSTVELLNLAAAIGFVLVAAGVALVVLDLVRIVVTKSDEPAENDPWSGHTLEWATTSPPPLANFATPVAVVTSERPFLDLKQLEQQQLDQPADGEAKNEGGAE